MRNKCIMNFWLISVLSLSATTVPSLVSATEPLEQLEAGSFVGGMERQSDEVLQTISRQIETRLSVRQFIQRESGRRSSPFQQTCETGCNKRLIPYLRPFLPEFVPPGYQDSNGVPKPLFDRGLQFVLQCVDNCTHRMERETGRVPVKEGDPLYTKCQPGCFNQTVLYVRRFYNDDRFEFDRIPLVGRECFWDCIDKCADRLRGKQSAPKFLPEEAGLRTLWPESPFEKTCETRCYKRLIPYLRRFPSEFVPPGYQGNNGAPEPRFEGSYRGRQFMLNCVDNCTDRMERETGRTGKPERIQGSPRAMGIDNRDPMWNVCEGRCRQLFGRGARFASKQQTQQWFNQSIRDHGLAYECIDDCAAGRMGPKYVSS